MLLGSKPETLDLGEQRLRKEQKTVVGLIYQYGKFVTDPYRESGHLSHHSRLRRSDFEFKQLLRAYRRGLVDESTFEREMTAAESGSADTGAVRGGFKAFGKSYPNEREAILDFLDYYGSAEAAAGVALDRWASFAKTDCIAGGIRMIAEREGYHSRIF